MNAFQPGVPIYNESFGGGTAAQMVTQLYTAGGVIDRINAHPDADVVWLSAGGNDMLLGNLGGGFYVNNPNNPNVYAAIRANVQTIVDAILANRPDLQVVIMGYDYLNIWDQVSGSAGNAIRANLGVSQTGNTFLDATQNQAVNDGFKAAEAGKIAIADASRRVAEVSNFGLNNTYGGYTGYFGNFAAGSTYPPELYPFLPTPPNRMNPGDAIHLNNLGYTTLALHAEQDFLLSAFSAASLGLSTGALAFGNVRIGTSSSLDVTASNTGANFTKVKDLNLAAATGDFSGGGQSFQPLFQDPTLGSDTATAAFAFAPTNHGATGQMIGVSSSSGSPSMALSGQGVGPAYSSSVTLSFASVVTGTTPTANLAVSNATGDGNLGNLTNLTLLSASISGANAARFSLTNFNPSSVLGAGVVENLAIQFDATGAGAGDYTAQLTFTTDQQAAFGSAGQQFSITLTAHVLPLASVVGRQIFYNQSKFDGGSASVNSSDDAAIAPDKTAYLPGSGAATFANITSYSRGINGIMVDVANPAGPITASDFTFKVGANNIPSSWNVAPTPSTVVVRSGAGVSGADRVEIVWAAGAITNTWLEVLVTGNDAAGEFNTNTGLATSDVFFFGNRIGDTGSGTATLAITNASDEIATRNNQGVGATVTNVFDFDRSGVVNATDQIASRNNVGTLVKINTSNPPATPEAITRAPAAEDMSMATALAVSNSNLPTALQSPTWLLSQLESGNLNGGFVARWFVDLAYESVPRARAAIVAAGEAVGPFGFDDELIESLLADLGLQ